MRGAHRHLLCAGKGQMWSPSDDNQIPEYYRQWTATIEKLGHDEQLRTLAQMSEEDRLIVQRLMDHTSVRLSSRDLNGPEVCSPGLIAHVTGTQHAKQCFCHPSGEENCIIV